MTQDSDLVTEMQLEHVQPFIEALQNEFYINGELDLNYLQIWARELKVSDLLDRALDDTK